FHLSAPVHGIFRRGGSDPPLNYFWGGPDLFTGQQVNAMIVMKFGGTSLQGAPQIRQVGSIIKRFARSRPVVVVSAMAGVTDDLIALAERSVAGLPREVSQRLDRLYRRHRRGARLLGVGRRGARRLAAGLGARVSG